MRKSTILSAVFAATVAVGLQGCSSGPPSEGDLAESLEENGGLTADQAECVAKGLADSDLSDDQLNAIADDDRSGLSDGDEDEAIEIITEVSVECVGGDLPEVPSVPEVPTPS